MTYEIFHRSREEDQLFTILSLILTPTCLTSVMNLDVLTRRGLYLSDIPLHDATRDLVLLGEQFREEYKLTQELEILTDRLQHTLRALEDEKKKTDRSVMGHRLTLILLSHPIAHPSSVEQHPLGNFSFDQQQIFYLFWSSEAD